MKKIVSTWRRKTIDTIKRGRKEIEGKEMGEEVKKGINAFLQVREVVLAAYVEGHFSSNDRVLVVGRLGDTFEMVVFIDMRFDESVSRRSSSRSSCASRSPSASRPSAPGP